MALGELGRFDRMEAHMIVGALAAEGIDALVFDGDMSIGEGSALLIPARVMVDSDDLPAARAWLEATRPRR